MSHLTLPAFALAFSWAAYVAQISRASVREQEGKEHVATARGRGLPSALIFRRHVLRNASLPIVTVSGLTVAGLIAGSIVVETAFGIGGMGSLLVQSVSAKDYNVVLAISMILVLAFVLATTIVRSGAPGAGSADQGRSAGVSVASAALVTVEPAAEGGSRSRRIRSCPGGDRGRACPAGPGGSAGPA